MVYSFAPQLPVSVQGPVRFAMAVNSAFNRREYATFFALLRSAPYLEACAMYKYVRTMRERALRTMSNSYIPNEQYPLKELVEQVWVVLGMGMVDGCGHGWYGGWVWV